MNKLSAAVIAGGMSKRYGSDKTLALLEGKPLISWAVDGARICGARIFVVSKDSGKFSFVKDVEFVEDKYDIQCPMVGIVTLFNHTTDDAFFIISADMPLFPFASVNTMYEAFKGFDAAVPDIGGRMYPCAAIYHRRTAAIFEKMLKEGDYKLMNAFDKLNVIKLGEDFFTPHDKNMTGFINANTPSDLEMIAKRKI
ncbi:MAG: molybdenum cofactor guanylyltransferase [Deferribacteraceae bacterium]|jgi:molybdopterin-guanine dinucleotide biosynthesis protein A|nr:molybdenum cofactor guanylyltransferase [Deferribacteraceae bacterium]